jgi:hypothetical protein
MSVISARSEEFARRCQNCDETYRLRSGSFWNLQAELQELHYPAFIDPDGFAVFCAEPPKRRCPNFTNPKRLFGRNSSWSTIAVARAQGFPAIGIFAFNAAPRRLNFTYVRRGTSTRGQPWPVPNPSGFQECEQRAKVILLIVVHRKVATRFRVPRLSFRHQGNHLLHILRVHLIIPGT